MFMYSLIRLAEELELIVGYYVLNDEEYLDYFGYPKR